MKKVIFLSTFLLATTSATFASQKQTAIKGLRSMQDDREKLSLVYQGIQNALAKLKSQAKNDYKLSAILALDEFNKLITSENTTPIDIHNSAAKKILTELGLINDLGSMNPLVLRALRKYKSLDLEETSDFED